MSRRGASTPGIDGLLVVDKPTGVSSHDVVAMLRRAYGQRRVGHAGTLDPSAAGVLLVCLGRATRLLEYMVGCDKSYTGQIVLGLETDTCDADGEVIETADASALTADQVAAALQALIGDIQQVPPAVSAKKINGQPAYRLARRGEIPALEAVPVRVHAIDLIGFEPGPQAVAHVSVRCGSGTYIRSLAHDLGAALGVGAHLRGLVRTSVGRHTRDQAINADTLAQMPAADRLAALRPLRECVESLPAVTVSPDVYPLLRDGKLLPAAPERGVVALLSGDGEVLAVAESRDDGIHPRKVLLGPDD